MSHSLVFAVIACASTGDRLVDVLVAVHGRDQPGITAGLMDVLSETDARIYDVEQIVVRGRLTLNILIGVAGQQATIRDLLDPLNLHERVRS